MTTDWTSIESVTKLAQEQEQKLGANNLQLAETLAALADLQFIASDFGIAEATYWRVLSIRQKALGEHHKDTAATLESLAELYEIQDRYAEATRFYQWANAVRKRALLKEHSDKLERTVQGKAYTTVLPQVSDLNRTCDKCGRKLLDAEMCLYCTQSHTIDVGTLLGGLLKGNAKPAEPAPPKNNNGPVNALLREDVSQQYMLDEPEITIGRHPNNIIVVDTDKAISRKHAKIIYDAGHFYITDCNTVNGTYVNSQKISEPTKLSEGDQVVIGNVTFKAAFIHAQK